MKKYLLLILSVCVFPFFPSLANAGEEPTFIFTKPLSREEVFRHQVFLFDFLDYNKDNEITKEELTDFKLGQSDVDEFFRRLDDNSDGKITKSEILYKVSVEFGNTDRNKDGYISENEFMEDFPNIEKNSKRSYHQIEFKELE